MDAAASGESIYHVLRDSLLPKVAKAYFPVELVLEACDAATVLQPQERQDVVKRVWPPVAVAVVAYLRSLQHGRHGGPSARPVTRTYDQLLAAIAEGAYALAEAAEELMHQSLEPQNRGDVIDVGRWKALQELSFALNISQLPDDIRVRASIATDPCIISHPIYPGWGPNGFESLRALHDRAEEIRRSLRAGCGLYAGQKGRGRSPEPDRRGFVIDLALAFAAAKPDTTFGTAPSSDASKRRSTELGLFIERIFEIIEREEIFEHRASPHERPNLRTVHRYLEGLRGSR